MFRRLVQLLVIILLVLAGLWIYRNFIVGRPPYVMPPPKEPVVIPAPPSVKPPVVKPVPPEPPPTIPGHVKKLIDSLMQQTLVTRSYDPSYVGLKYPGGDVAESTGVCADVVIRAFRANGIDLQQAVHEDMRRHFSDYPKRWGLKRPDANIDHRRVYNLMRFFERQGSSLPISDDPDSYLPGDVVAWDLGTGQAHIGVVTQYKTPNGIPLMVHNVAYGANLENALFYWPIIGHYRYFNAPEGVTVARPGRTTTAPLQ